MSVDFESWLSSRLVALGTDHTVFTPYILSILEGEDETSEEKEEGLVGILSDVLDSEEAIQETLKEILEQWRKAQVTAAEDEVAKTSDKLGKIDIVEKMNMITQQKLANYVPKKQEELTEEQKKIKEAILQGYGEAALSDDEDGEEGGGGGGGDLSLSVSKITRVSNTVGGLEAIDNAASSHAEQVEMREKQKAASSAKKDKDKLDLANQKKGAEDRKKKAQARAAKGERKA